MILSKEPERSVPTGLGSKRTAKHSPLRRWVSRYGASEHFMTCPRVTITGQNHMHGKVPEARAGTGFSLSNSIHSSVLCQFPLFSMVLPAGAPALQSTVTRQMCSWALLPSQPQALCREGTVEPSPLGQ